MVKAGSRHGQGKVKARSEQVNGKVKERFRQDKSKVKGRLRQGREARSRQDEQSNHIPNPKYNLMGLTKLKLT